MLLNIKLVDTMYCERLNTFVIFAKYALVFNILQFRYNAIVIVFMIYQDVFWHS